MKKLIATILAAVMLACGCAAAFADTYAILTWNEELQRYEIQIIERDNGPYMNVNPEDATTGEPGFILPDGTVIEIKQPADHNEYFDPLEFGIDF